ncbi:MAG: hypothetical protein AAGE84_26680 [Cyanobacteria bacterium P01_G01_bin.39]
MNVGRPKSSDYEIKRQALLDVIEERLVQVGHQASLSALATAAKVTVPTLKHYFGNRDQVICAVLEAGFKRGQKFMAVARTTELPFDESITDLLMFVRQGLERGRLGNLHVIGLCEGLHHHHIGPYYLDKIFNPSITATAERLKLHQSRAEMKCVDPRNAAICLISPLIIMLLHQKYLGGGQEDPVNLDRFCQMHSHSFVNAYKETKS